MRRVYTMKKRKKNIFYQKNKKLNCQFLISFGPKDIPNVTTLKSKYILSCIRYTIINLHRVC